jgi:hypothetical protein
MALNGCNHEGIGIGIAKLLASIYSIVSIQNLDIINSTSEINLRDCIVTKVGNNDK